MQKSSNINKKVLDEMYENDESIEETSNCKCSEILKMILKKVYRKSFTVIDMMNEMKCINTLRIFVKTDLEETSLMHVCHKHLLRLADHFDLQVKMLNSAELRNWLCQCWEHRSNLIAFKMSFQSTLWWHLKSRSWCICKMFYQIKSLKIIWIWLSKSNHQWDCKVFDMRQLSRDRKSDHERCF